MPDQDGADQDGADQDGADQDGLEARVAAVASLASRARSAAAMDVASLASRARSTATAAGRRVVVLVDGRSGTGKTTLGAALASELGAQLVHLDDVYPGWDGLQAAAEAVVSDVVGAPSGYRRWDWVSSAPADWVSLDPDASLVVEGCGALSRASAPTAVLRVWMLADDAVRKQRALDRDGAVFAAEWDRWARQETAFIAREDPASLADVVLRS